MDLKVRVAVIDSGVNQRHPHISAIAGGVAAPFPAVPGSEYAAAVAGYNDTLGHGTAVMAAIQEKAPSAEYFAVKLFDASLRASTGDLFQALHWAIDHRMDVINLSLGTRNPNYSGRFSEIVARAAERGSVIVAARESQGELCYPGCLPGVVSVGLDWDCPRDGFRYSETSQGAVFHASGYPRSLPGVPRERNLNGISFAVANMTGFVIRAYGESTDRSFESLRRTLAAQAIACETAT